MWHTTIQDPPGPISLLLIVPRPSGVLRIEDPGQLLGCQHPRTSQSYTLTCSLSTKLMMSCAFLKKPIVFRYENRLNPGHMFGISTKYAAPPLPLQTPRPTLGRCRHTAQVHSMREGEGTSFWRCLGTARGVGLETDLHEDFFT